MKRNLAMSTIVLLAFAFTPAPAKATNAGDFKGGVAVGSGYAVVDTAPTDGLIVEGSVGIGTSNPSSATLQVAGTILSSISTGSVAVIGVTSNSSGGGVLGDNSGTGYYCYLADNGYAINCAGPSAGVSDQRLKKDIRPLDAKEGLDAIMKIKPVHYMWQDERMNKAHPDGEIGFIAQNVETVLPQLVGEIQQREDAPIKLPSHTQKVLEYDRISAPLVLAIQQLKADNDSLRAEFEAYKKAHP
jgi:hypothetical protein